MQKYLNFLFPALVFLLPLGLYLYHLAPTYIPIDSAEFTMCMHAWGLCHPPGFPLYVVLGHFFLNLFPVGEVIWRANLISALFGAGTIFLVFLILKKLNVRNELSFLGSLMLAVSTSFWEFSLAADVFTFGTFLVALSLLFVFWQRTYLSLFVLGLSASHFYLTAVLWPVYVWYFRTGTSNGANESNRSKIIQLLQMTFIFALGFFPQIILYFRMQTNPEINWGHHEGIGGFIEYVRRKEFGSGFLLSNPALVYSPLKNAQHIWTFLKSWLMEFGLILPIFALFAAILAAVKKREMLLLLASFLVYAFVQLFLLSTIDPGGDENPFQLNKFYLVPFLIGTILTAVGFDNLIKKYLKDFSNIFSVFFASLVLIYFLVNWQSISFRNNYFSQNLVLDAIDQLPPDSIAVTVSHIVYFGARYEQVVNGKYNDIKLVYFPNEKNKDNEHYQSELFTKPINHEFVGEVERASRLGAAEKYVLSFIARNLDREIYILQGTFEEGFFKFIKTNTRPHGLWWRVEDDIQVQPDNERLERLLLDLRNGEVKFSDLSLKQQKLDLLGYAVSYNSTGIYFASIGEYGKALKYLEKSYNVRPKEGPVLNSMNLIKEAARLESDYQNIIARKDESALIDFAKKLEILGNYRRCEDVKSQLAIISNVSAIGGDLCKKE